jgi:formylglycine-generating enzyme required for sulfatase activity
VIAWDADNSGDQHIDADSILRADQRNYESRLFENHNGPHPVAQKQPNAWKLYDMLGNVWQWTADWYDSTSYAGGDSRDPVGPAGGQQRVLRGGSWADGAFSARTSTRFRAGPIVRMANNGVRCVEH